MSPSSLNIPLLIFFLSLLVPLTACALYSEQDSNISSSPIDIEWKLVSNFEPDNKLRASLTFINNGGDPLPSSGWALYFNSIRILDTGSFPEDYNVSHINGYLFKLEPAESFEPLDRGERRNIEYLARYFAIKKSDAPEGFYFVLQDGSIQTVESVMVHPFETADQLNRSPGDNIPVPTPEYTYDKNSRLQPLTRSVIGSITPTPSNQVFSDDIFVFPEILNISYDPDFEQEAEFLANSMNYDFGIKTQTSPDDQSGSYYDLSITRAEEPFSSNEAYSLNISPENITLSASGRQGAFYAVQSLRALISNRPGDNLEIRSAAIQDEPAFTYRGMHLDVARNFQPAESVKRLLDIMAMYKLNKFHFHLTDDEGWRLEIGPLPELTNVGGRRGHTETEEAFMIPVYGSGPDPSPGASMGSGWYTRDEYIDILKYAAERHIEVIPEIDVPGHARAAILAMKARTDRFNQSGDTESAERYKLHEPEDQSTYRSVQNYTDNVINVCQESAYRFMDLVIDEIIAMHREADVPLTMIHMGGDEVPHGAWKDSPACADKMDELGIRNVRQLQSYFFGRLSNKLSEHGLRMGGWEEVALTEDEDGASGVNPDFVETTTPYAWSNVWGSGTEDRAYRLANAGYKVVMSHASNFYFDLAYDKHWQEPGFYWAAMLDTEAPFSFIPYNLFKNASQTSYGNPLTDNYFDEMVQLDDEARENILGLQGQLWTETVNESGRMDYMIFPRLLGLAERAWAGEPEWSRAENSGQLQADHLAAWNEFAHRIGTLESARLDRIYSHLQYRIPAPGAVIRNDTLFANMSLPGFTIRYETGDIPLSTESPVYSKPVPLNGQSRIKLAAFSSNGRAGRSVIVTN